MNNEQIYYQQLSDEYKFNKYFKSMDDQMFKNTDDLILDFSRINCQVDIVIKLWTFVRNPIFNQMRYMTVYQVIELG